MTLLVFWALAAIAVHDVGCFGVDVEVEDGVAGGVADAFSKTFSGGEVGFS